MIVVNGIVESTASDIEALKEAVAKMEIASRAEAGCRDYTFSVELNNPNKLRITECWESMEALQAHFQVAHMAEFQQAMAANPPLSLDVTFYEAEELPSPMG